MAPRAPEDKDGEGTRWVWADDFVGQPVAITPHTLKKNGDSTFTVAFADGTELRVSSAARTSRLFKRSGYGNAMKLEFHERVWIGVKHYIDSGENFAWDIYHEAPKEKGE